jgi:hypothetical protein
MNQGEIECSLDNQLLYTEIPPETEHLLGKAMGRKNSKSNDYKSFDLLYKIISLQIVHTSVFRQYEPIIKIVG